MNIMRKKTEADTTIVNKDSTIEAMETKLDKMFKIFPTWESGHCVMLAASGNPIHKLCGN